jgi:hypothetical protein
VLSFLAGCGSSSPGGESRSATQSSSALVGDACASDADCSATEYCASPEGQCGGGGTCASRGINVMCMSTVQPVCACDGSTYRNACEAKKHGASLAFDDVCTTQPVPFLLQFADTYDVTQPSSTNLATLALSTDGTYLATMNDGTIESGVYTSYGQPTLPFDFALTSGTNWWTARITTYAGPLAITRDGASDVATPEDPVGPNESICDSSGGQWSDDETDPATGLFCLCPSGQSYVPSQGGCI